MEFSSQQGKWLKEGENKPKSQAEPNPKNNQRGWNFPNTDGTTQQFYSYINRIRIQPKEQCTYKLLLTATTNIDATP